MTWFYGLYWLDSYGKLQIVFSVRREVYYKEHSAHFYAFEVNYFLIACFNQLGKYNLCLLHFHQLLIIKIAFCVTYICACFKTVIHHQCHWWVSLVFNLKTVRKATSVLVIQIILGKYYRPLSLIVRIKPTYIFVHQKYQSEDIYLFNSIHSNT